jgi:hypothetical protein
VSESQAELLQHNLAATLQQEPDRFAEVVRGLMDTPAPPTRDVLLIALHALRNEARAASDARRENLVLDMLDWVVGWCSPGSQPPFRRQ